ncbi:DUF1883 domain-containing protein [Micromonospora taraxaci]|uniref:DUF1883 domain-containing protein n=1 Tax=Micromonospora taraxaci TaxID=1316803 RepID=UPI0033A5B2FF
MTSARPPRASRTSLAKAARPCAEGSRSADRAEKAPPTSYVDGDEYEFFGGFYDLTPVVLEVPYDDHWWLIVDSNPDNITVTVNQVFDDD